VDENPKRNLNLTEEIAGSSTQCAAVERAQDRELRVDSTREKTERPAVISRFRNDAVHAQNTRTAVNKPATPGAPAPILKTDEKTDANADQINEAVEHGSISRLRQDKQKTATKPISPQKLAANRLNAKKSTGARTGRGKNASKFNAVKTGLFAKHVVIPVCDGDRSGEQFGRLLADLEQEFQPEGLFEEFWVGQIAECMWRLRRATCAEKGSVQNAAEWNGEPPNVFQQIEPYSKTLSIIEKGQAEIRTTGTLSRASYAAILSILKADDRYTAAEKASSSAEPKIDDQFLAVLKYRAEILENYIIHRVSCSGRMAEDYYAENSLPPEVTMNKILRYERAVQKKLDWALQKLLESQQRRKNSQTPS
jgi:hypothetical protein